jgi:hypothetical protein
MTTLSALDGCLAGAQIRPDGTELCAEIGRGSTERGRGGLHRSEWVMNNGREVMVGAVLLAVIAFQARADAAQVNVAATAFHTQIGGGDSIKYFGSGSTNFTGSTLTMIAALPRVPGGSAVTVFVDGYGVSGTYNCTISSSVASKSFSMSSVVSWSQSVNFTAVELPSSSYLSITCTVPADGAFRGVTITG